MSHDFSSVTYLTDKAGSHSRTAKGAIGSHTDKDIAHAINELGEAVNDLADAINFLTDILNRN